MAGTRGRGIDVPSSMGRVDPSSIVVAVWMKAATMVVASMVHYCWAPRVLGLELMSSSWGGGLEYLPWPPLCCARPGHLRSGLLH